MSPYVFQLTSEAHVTTPVSPPGHQGALWLFLSVSCRSYYTWSDFSTLRRLGVGSSTAVDVRQVSWNQTLMKPKPKLCWRRCRGDRDLVSSPVANADLRVGIRLVNETTGWTCSTPVVGTQQTPNTRSSFTVVQTKTRRSPLRPRLQDELLRFLVSIMFHLIGLPM